MDYIKKENNEYIWDYDKIINSDISISSLINNNLYFIKDDMVYIFYIKKYKLTKSNKQFEFETRNELLLSLYLKNYEQLGYDTYFNGYFNSKIDKCCEFCFNYPLKTIEIKTCKRDLVPSTGRLSLGKSPNVIICKNCLITKQEKNYYVNNRSFKSINSINIEMVKKLNSNLLYFYSVKQHYDDLFYIKLTTPRWYQISDNKLCQLCHRNSKRELVPSTGSLSIGKSYLMECEECHQFSLDQYSIIYMKSKYFELILNKHLPFDIIYYILKHYIELINIDKSCFLNYYENINKKDDDIIINNKNKIIDDSRKNDYLVEVDDLYLEIYQNIINNNDNIVDNNDNNELINYNDCTDDECDLTDFDNIDYY